MMRKNIEAVYCKVGVITPSKGIVTIYTKDKVLFGNLPAQIEQNMINNLWDFGLPERPYIIGEEILSISVWDKMYTYKYSDQNPEGVITGKSGTARKAKPSIY